MKIDRHNRQKLARAMSRMNPVDRAMTKAIHGFRKKQTGGFSIMELECLVLSSLAAGKRKQ